MAYCSNDHVKKIKFLYLRLEIFSPKVGFGGLGVTCLPRDPRFAGSNLAEVDRFFPEHKSSGRDFKLGVPSLRFQAC